ncbi:hypothetical protein [Rhizobium subbaraonis]|nr:hypothetical protein [Rhizobium subbaraonis]
MLGIDLIEKGTVGDSGLSKATKLLGMTIGGVGAIIDTKDGVQNLAQKWRSGEAATDTDFLFFVPAAKTAHDVGKIAYDNRHEIVEFGRDTLRKLSPFVEEPSYIQEWAELEKQKIATSENLNIQKYHQMQETINAARETSFDRSFTDAGFYRNEGSITGELGNIEQYNLAPDTPEEIRTKAPESERVIDSESSFRPRDFDDYSQSEVESSAEFTSSRDPNYGPPPDTTAKSRPTRTPQVYSRPCDPGEVNFTTPFPVPGRC